jgi:hypothetical protein
MIKASSENMTQKYTKRQIRNINIIRTVSLVPIIILGLSLLIFHVEWAKSIQNVEVTYDFSNYIPNATGSFVLGDITEGLPSENLSPPTNPALTTYFQSMYQYLSDTEQGTTFNFTEAEQYLLENQEHYVFTGTNLTEIQYQALSTVGKIEYTLNQTITIAHQIYSAYQTGNLTDYLMQLFIQDLWTVVQEQLIPPAWLQPSYILVHNTGNFPITQFLIHGDFILQTPDTQKIAGFLDLNQTRIAIGDTAQIEITLAEIVTAVLTVTLEEIIQITLDVLINSSIAELNQFPEYLTHLFQNYNLQANIIGSGRIGLLNFNTEIIVDLSTIIRQLVEEMMPN